MYKIITEDEANSLPGTLADPGDDLGYYENKDRKLCLSSRYKLLEDGGKIWYNKINHEYVLFPAPGIAMYPIGRDEA